MSPSSAAPLDVQCRFRYQWGMSVVCVVLLASVCRTMRLISTDPRLMLPPKDGKVEILRSSLLNLEEMTLCARIKTHNFNTQPDSAQTTQILVYLEDTWLLATLAAMPCEQAWAGCTQSIQGMLGHHWRQGRVLGYFREPQGDNNTPLREYYPVWPPARWNTVCITASTTRLQININTESVLQTTLTKAQYFKVDKETFNK